MEIKNAQNAQLMTWLHLPLIFPVSVSQEWKKPFTFSYSVSSLLACGCCLYHERRTCLFISFARCASKEGEQFLLLFAPSVCLPTQK